MSSPASIERKPSDVFRDIYVNGEWGPAWSSGSGSDPNKEGKTYCQLIPALLKVMKAQVVVDLGCGDGRILASIACELPEVKFWGVDCVAEQIERLRKLMPHHFWQMNELDNISDFNKIPVADVYLIKDVLHHWPNDRIVTLLEYLRKRFALQGRGALIATQDVNQGTADDCQLGAYRALDGAKDPLKQFSPLLLTKYLHKAVYLFQF